MSSLKIREFPVNNCFATVSVLLAGFESRQLFLLERRIPLLLDGGPDLLHQMVVEVKIVSDHQPESEHLAGL